MFIIIRHN